jgi:hypothetical protein
MELKFLKNRIIYKYFAPTELKSIIPRLIHNFYLYKISESIL